MAREIFADLPVNRALIRAAVRRLGDGICQDRLQGCCRYVRDMARADLAAALYQGNHCLLRGGITISAVTSLAAYEGLIEKLAPLVKQGLAAAIYTQTSDVEGEVNGLLTYDRKVVKFDEARLAELHRKLQ